MKKISILMDMDRTQTVRTNFPAKPKAEVQRTKSQDADTGHIGVLWELMVSESGTFDIKEL